MAKLKFYGIDFIKLFSGFIVMLFLSCDSSSYSENENYSNEGDEKHEYLNESAIESSNENSKVINKEPIILPSHLNINVGDPCATLINYLVPQIQMNPYTVAIQVMPFEDNHITTQLPLYIQFGVQIDYILIDTVRIEADKHGKIFRRIGVKLNRGFNAIPVHIFTEKGDKNCDEQYIEIDAEYTTPADINVQVQTE